MQNLKPLASLCSWAGRFESYLVANPERFSCDEAQFLWVLDQHDWNTDEYVFKPEPKKF